MYLPCLYKELDSILAEKLSLISSIFCSYCKILKKCKLDTALTKMLIPVYHKYINKSCSDIRD